MSLRPSKMKLFGNISLIRFLFLRIQNSIASIPESCGMLEYELVTSNLTEGNYLSTFRGIVDVNVIPYKTWNVFTYG